LLACTEFSIAFDGHSNIDGLKIIDSSTEYARATIDFAKHRVDIRNMVRCY
jgi:aspartate/glutamate racemase